MDRYVTGDVIRALREKKGMTQEALAQRLFVSAKAVSKWETGKGYPDISLLEPLAAVSDRGVQLIKLYPEEEALARFRIEGVRRVYGYCNRHGLFAIKL